MTTLVINRHPLDWTVGIDGRRLPIPAAERVLLTRTFDGGLRSWTPESFPDVVVTDMTKADQLEDVARWLAESREVTSIVSIHEKDLLMAARLRELRGLPGPTPEQLLPFRDKLLMKRRLRDHGYDALPRVLPGEAVASLSALPWSGRSVVKSRWGLGASEVTVVEDEQQLTAAVESLGGDPARLQIEEFVDGPMCHVDSVVVDGEITFAAVSRYLDPPGNFAKHRFQASYNMLPGELYNELLEHNRAVLTALGLHNCVTHVEFFLAEGGIVFCEAAARPGGGGIDLMVSNAHGVDLIDAAVLLQCGVAPELEILDFGVTTYGAVGIYRNRVDTDISAEISRLGSALVSYEYRPQRLRGKVRHTTDFGHLAVVRAEGEASFHDVVAQLSTILDEVAAADSEEVA
jgi:hypothetical protein